MMTAMCIAAFSLILIYLEFFLPGAVLGMIGGLGVACSIGLFIWQSDHFFKSLTFSLAVGILLGLTIKLALWKLKKIPIFSPKDAQVGYVASTFDQKLIGQTGEAASDLKPSGYILIEGKRYPAISDSRYIKKGESIKIIAGQGGHFIVKTLSKESE